MKEVLLMVLLNSMTGGLRTESGFDSNFNLLLPLLMSDNCSTNNSECEKMQKNLMVMMMALQSTVRKGHFEKIKVKFESSKMKKKHYTD